MDKNHIKRVINNIPKDKKNDVDFILKLAKVNPEVLDIALENTTNKELALKIMERDFDVISRVSETLRGDADFILRAMHLDKKAFDYATPSLKSEKNFMLQAIKIDRSTYFDAAEGLMADEDLIIEAITPEESIPVVEEKVQEEEKEIPSEPTSYSEEKPVLPQEPIVEQTPVVPQANNSVVFPEEPVNTYSTLDDLVRETETPEDGFAFKNTAVNLEQPVEPTQVPSQPEEISALDVINNQVQEPTPTLNNVELSNPMNTDVVVPNLEGAPMFDLNQMYNNEGQMLK